MFNLTGASLAALIFKQCNKGGIDDFTKILFMAQHMCCQCQKFKHLSFSLICFQSTKAYNMASESVVYQITYFTLHIDYF